MSTKLLLSTVLFFLINASSFAQNNKALLTLYNQFQEIEFDFLHVYTDGRQEQADYSKLSPYPFKGTLLGAKLSLLLKDIILDQPENKQYFATYRYAITSELEGLIIRMYDLDMHQNIIYSLIYNKKSNQLVQSVELATDYHAEGGSGMTQSWLTDLNEDNNKDVLVRTFYDTYKLDPTKEDANHLQHIREEETYIKVWNSNFKKITITDSDILTELHQKFVYRFVDTHFLDYEIQKHLNKVLSQD